MDASGHEFDVREWPDGEPVTCARDEGEPRHMGIVRVSHQWFTFLSLTVRTAEGPVLVTSLYLVVTTQEALADKRRLGMNPDAGHPRRWFSDPNRSVPAKVFELMEGREDLVYRVSARESLWTGDLDGPLQKAIEQLRTELSTRSAWELRELRRDPSHEWHIMPSERMEDALRVREIEESVESYGDDYGDDPSDSWS